MLATAMASIRYFKKPKSTVPAEVVVGTSADFPPFSFIDQAGSLTGFDIDLIDEIFKRLALAYRIENMPFESLLPQMQFGSVDMIAAGMSPTPERAARIIFSDAYLQADPLTIVSLATHNTIHSIEDLAGKTVAVNQGYVADMKLSERSEIVLLRLPSISDAILALQHGKADAFVTGARTVKPLKATLGETALQVTPIEQIQEITALGISKKLPHLAERVNTVLQQMHDDGTLTVLQEKWHLT